MCIMLSKSKYSLCCRCTHVHITNDVFTSQTQSLSIMTEGVNYVNPTCLATTKILKVEDMRSEDKCTWRLTEIWTQVKTAVSQVNRRQALGFPRMCNIGHQGWSVPY